MAELNAGCWCGSQQPFSECCQPLLVGKRTADTPELLMRSRYSAFCTANIDYLITTHHPSRRKPDDRERLAQSMAETEWLGLRVLQHQSVQDTRERGFVEFVAFFREKLFSTEPDLAKKARQADNRQPGQLHEKSEFVREKGRWYYLQGLSLPPIKITRNDPCWCGSGKKFKQCHARGK